MKKDTIYTMYRFSEPDLDARLEPKMREPIRLHPARNLAIPDDVVILNRKIDSAGRSGEISNTILVFNVSKHLTVVQVI